MTTTDPFTPAIVTVQRDASDRDAKLGAAILELWDLLVRVLELSDGEQVTDPDAIASLRPIVSAPRWTRRTRRPGASQAPRPGAGMTARGRRA